MKNPSQPCSSAATASFTRRDGSPKGPTLGTPTAHDRFGVMAAALTPLLRVGAERREERPARRAEPADGVIAHAAGQVPGAGALAHDRQGRRLVVADAEHGGLGHPLPLRVPES